jgi:cell wall-associated NlpC family hydrolase
MSRPVSSDEVVAAARAYLGVAFRHQGRSRTGLDCLGLTGCALRDAGLMVRDSTAYGRRPDYKRLKRAADGELIRLARTTPLCAGVIVMFRDADWIHVGIMTGQRCFIHARGAEGGSVVEHILDDQSWAPRLIAAWRHPGMEWESAHV